MTNPYLQVRIRDAKATRMVEAALLDDLEFSSTAPGGFMSAKFATAAVARDAVQAFTTYATVDVIDKRHGGIVWSGRLEEPGRDYSDGSLVRTFGAVGGGTHATDQTKPVVYTDTRPDMWAQTEQVVGGFTINSTYAVDQTGDVGLPGNKITLGFPKGASLPVNGTRSVGAYAGFFDSGQFLARFGCDLIAGKTSANMEFHLVGRGGPSAVAILKNVTGNVASAAFVATRGTDFSGQDHRQPEIRAYWPGAGGSTVGDDLFWFRVSNLRVTATRLDRFGNPVPEADYATEGSGILPHRIVEDVLGRFLPEYADTTAEVDTTLTDRVDQLAYDELTDAEGILSDLMALYPSHFWGAWENNGDGYRFAWRPWPTIPSIDLDTGKDAFQSPGGASDLYNQVSVRWKDGTGRPRTVVVTGSSPALTAAGLTRRGILDLGGQLGSVASATKAGQAFLAAHKYPDNSGTIKVTRPVYDASQRRTVQPWELRAGVLVRVRNLRASGDSLNAAGDGSTVFRVSQVTYSAKANEATLTLDSYGQSVSKALAKLVRATSRARRL